MSLFAVRCENPDCARSGGSTLFETLSDDIVYRRDKRGDMVLLGVVLYTHCRRCGMLWRNPRYPNHEALLKARVRALPPSSD